VNRGWKHLIASAPENYGRREVAFIVARDNLEPAFDSLSPAIRSHGSYQVARLSLQRPIDAFCPVVFEEL